MDAPNLENELVNAGDVLPANPVLGQKFVFRVSATGLTAAVDDEGNAVTDATARQSFRYNGASWVREEQNDRILPDFGAYGYSRVEVVRNPRMLNGSAAAYTAWGRLSWRTRRAGRCRRSNRHDDDQLQLGSVESTSAPTARWKSSRPRRGRETADV